MKVAFGENGFKVGIVPCHRGTPVVNRTINPGRTRNKSKRSIRGYHGQVMLSWDKGDTFPSWPFRIYRNRMQHIRETMVEDRSTRSHLNRKLTIISEKLAMDPHELVEKILIPTLRLDPVITQDHEVGRKKGQGIYKIAGAYACEIDGEYHDGARGAARLGGDNAREPGHDLVARGVGGLSRRGV